MATRPPGSTESRIVIPVTVSRRIFKKLCARARFGDLYVAASHGASSRIPDCKAAAAELLEKGLSDDDQKKVEKLFPLGPPRGESDARPVTDLDAHRRKINAKSAKRIRLLLDQGVSVITIAQRLGVARSTIVRHLESQAEQDED